MIVILATATAHLILAESPDPDPREKEQNPSLLQSEEPGSSINLPNIIESIKPFSKSKRLKRLRWSRGMFSKAIKNLGILKIPGLKLVKVRKTFMRSLEKVRGHMIKIRSRSRYGDSGIHRNERDAKLQKKALYDLCQETVDSIYMLAHADERLAYRVESVRCEGVCHSTSLKLTLGECVLKKKTMVVYVLDDFNNLFPKTIDVGCACECLTHFI